MRKGKTNKIQKHKKQHRKTNKKIKRHNRSKRQYYKKIYGGNTPESTTPLLDINDLTVAVPNSPTSVAEINTPPNSNESVTILPVEDWEEIGPELTNVEEESEEEADEQVQKRRRLTFGGKRYKSKLRKSNTRKISRKQKGGIGFTVTEGTNENDDRTSIH
jgi:hypothetical protein